MSATAWVIRHLAFEDLGSFSEPLSEQRYVIRYLDAGVDSLLPLMNASEMDLLVVLGGPISAYEISDYPWLEEEITVIHHWLRQHRPILGICLGAQLMATALGARVYPGHEKEIGWSALHITDTGMRSPVRHFSADLTDMLHWHGDTFDLPDGAQLLASTAQYPHQVYRWGKRALAFQCHPEFTSDRVEQWLIGHAAELHAAGIDLHILRQQSHAKGADLKLQAKCFLTEWLETIR